MDKEISQEFLDKFNSSEIGKQIRLISNFYFTQETRDKIKRMYGINIDNNSNRSIDKLPKEVVKIMMEENTFFFDSQSIKVFIDGELNFNVSLLENGLDFKNLAELEEVVNVLKVKELSLTHISENIKFENLEVEELSLQGDEAFTVDFSNLKTIKKLSTKNASFDLETLENMSELETLRIETHNSPEIDFSKKIELPNLSVLDVTQDLNDEKVRNFLKLSKICELNCGNKSEHRLLNDQEVIVTSIEELKFVLNTNFFEGKKISYACLEPIPAELFQDIRRKVDLEICNPLVLSDEFCQKLNDNDNLHISIENDLYENYKLAEISAINKQIRDVIDNVPKDASDLEKIVYLCLKIKENNVYDYSGCKGNKDNTEERNQITRSLKGALLEHKVVCAGYALEFDILAKELGLNCRDVIGKRNEDHAWNEVEINGNSYNIDLTNCASFVELKSRINGKLMKRGVDSKNILKKDNDMCIKYGYRKIKTDYLDEHGNFDYEKYVSETDELGGSLHYVKDNSQKCKEDYDRKSITEAFRKVYAQIARVEQSVDSREIVNCIEENSQDLKKSDMSSSEKAIVDSEKQRLEKTNRMDNMIEDK